MLYLRVFFFSSRRRHTRCALVTGVQTCALPIYCAHHQHLATRRRGEACFFRLAARLHFLIHSAHPRSYPGFALQKRKPDPHIAIRSEERSVGKECVRRVDLGGRGIIKKKKRNTTIKYKLDNRKNNTK